MTLTVRLPPKLEDALDKYSASTGVTKTHVVQEALAEYLVQSKRARTDKVREPSETYKAFKKAGLIGCIRGMGGESATKEVVRRRVLESLKARG